MKTVPIVFAFNERYALPGAVSVLSLLQNAKPSTFYDIYILNAGLPQYVKDRFAAFKKDYPNHALTWVDIPRDRFKEAPTDVKWPAEVYFRLLMHEYLPKAYDKAIWSDVDVAFCADMSDIYDLDLGDADWAGVIAERNTPDSSGPHTKFPENKNKYIYMSGFMVANLKKWRAKDMTKTFMATIQTFGSRLKMVDLDVLNLSCRKIKAVPFDYCVLESIYDDGLKGRDAQWLLGVYTPDQLERARRRSKIIHYAGNRVKIWLRLRPGVFYKDLIRHSGFMDVYQRTCWFRFVRLALRPFVKILRPLTPLKSWRKKMKRFVQ